MNLAASCYSGNFLGETIVQNSYKRTVDELRTVASMFWPDDLSRQEAKLSIIPRLLDTQDDFIAILSVPVSNVERLFQVLSASEFPTNLFLRHLVVLANFGGEPLKRINAQFRTLSPDRRLDYIWRGGAYSYQFR